MTGPFVLLLFPIAWTALASADPCEPVLKQVVCTAKQEAIPALKPVCEAAAKLRFTPEECQVLATESEFVGKMLPYAKGDTKDSCARIPKFWCARFGANASSCDEALRAAVDAIGPLGWHCTRVFWDFVSRYRDREREQIKAALVASIREAQTFEATMNLQRLVDSASSYFEEEIADRSGNSRQYVLPRSAGPFPSGSACNQSGKRYRGGDWAACKSDAQCETWNALNFSIEDPHLFRYRVISSGTGKKARFVARAEADLACDGKWVVFEIKAKANGAGTKLVAGKITKKRGGARPARKAD